MPPIIPKRQTTPTPAPAPTNDADLVIRLAQSMRAAGQGIGAKRVALWRACQARGQAAAGIATSTPVP